jgi:uncharacterized membrane protein YczE
VRARLGLGPWDVFHQGVARHTGIPIGTVVILVGIPVLACWIPLRQRPGVGTIANLLLVGATIDVVLARLSAPGPMPVRIGFLVGGLAVQALGTGVYLTARFGPGPRDGLMTGIHLRAGWSIAAARTLVESSACAAGALLGGTVGVGTIVVALGIGPLVQLSLHTLGYRRPLPVVGDGPGEAVGLTGE